MAEKVPAAQGDTATQVCVAALKEKPTAQAHELWPVSVPVTRLLEPVAAGHTVHVSPTVVETFNENLSAAQGVHTMSELFVPFTEARTEPAAQEVDQAWHALPVHQ